MNRQKLRSLLRIMPVAGAAIVAFGLPVSAQETPAALADSPGFVFTANEFGNSISRIDLASGNVETVPVAVAAHNVQVTADGRLLLAVGQPGGDMEEMEQASSSGEMATTNGQLLIFDTAALSAGPVRVIEVGAYPAHVVADAEGRRAFVTNGGNGNVTVVDLALNTVIATIETGAGPHGQRISPDGKELYVANVTDGSVSILDPMGLKELDRISVGAAPVQVGFTPDGSRVYVSLRDEDKVAVIDPATRQVIAKVDVGNGPIQVYSTPDGRLVYAANQGTEEDPDETVSVIEVATNTNVATVRTGPGAHGVTVSRDGTLAFISNIFDGTVSVIDTTTNAVVANFAVGEGPNGITYLPARS